MSPTLSSPLRDVVGGKTAKAFETGLDLRTAGDLLRHYPRRYAERGVLTPLSDLREDEYVTVQAEIAKVDTRSMRNRRGTLVEVVVTDGDAQLRLTFFNQSWRASQLRPGQRGLFAGKVGSFNGRRQLTNPQTQLLEDDSDVEESMLTG
ncbi:MAG: ATP-dependent helicase RecG, partial [Frankiaceae bacterium]|nr:ATP-dependent helicase RecG [Frankiaceae bacterium]